MNVQEDIASQPKEIETPDKIDKLVEEVNMDLRKDHSEPF